MPSRNSGLGWPGPGTRFIPLTFNLSHRSSPIVFPGFRRLLERTLILEVMIRNKSKHSSWPNSCCLAGGWAQSIANLRGKTMMVSIGGSSVFSPAKKTPHRNPSLESNTNCQRFQYFWYCWKIFQNVAFEFSILAFSTNFFLSKMTCLVTLFDRHFQVFKNSPNWNLH